MAVKTFTQAEKLTAADTNTYLANAGLVYVTQTTFSAATEVVVDNCFTSTSANYKVLLDLSAISANDTVAIQFRNGSTTDATTNYDWTMLEYYNGSVAASSTVGGTYFRLQFTYTAPGVMAAAIDLFNPQAALQTQMISQAMSQNGTTWTLIDNVSGRHRATTQFTGIRIGNLATSQMTGRIRVYGYRNA